MNDLPDDLEAILKLPPSGASPELRGRLLEETSALLPRQMVRRPRAAVLVAAAVLIAAGLGWFVMRSRQPPGATEAATLTKSPATPAVPVTALDLEWRAFDSAPKEQAALYWSAGHEYVGAHGDYESALRCYRQALDTGTAESRQITDEDDVLAMALKLERTYQEKSP